MKLAELFHGVCAVVGGGAVKASDGEGKCNWGDEVK
jgi:hypothetical protein